MEQEYSTIKILLEKGHKSFKIKKFPIYIGSEKAPNVFRLPGDGVDPKHGMLFIEKNNLVYEDLSTNGTKIGSILRKKEKVKLTHGKSELKIGRYRIIIDNKYSIDKSLEIKNKRRKKIFTIWGLVIAFLILVVSGFFVYMNFLKPPVDVVVNDFTIVPDPLNYFDPAIFKSVKLESVSELNMTKIRGSLFIQKKDGTEDSLNFSNLTLFQGSIIPIPPGLISDQKNDETVFISLTLQGENYNFLPPRIKKQFNISNRKQIHSKENIILTTNITGYLLEYKIEDPLDKILSYEILLGDGRRFSPAMVFQSAISYYREGEYDLVSKFKLKDGRTVDIHRKVIVD